ncbi:MAG: urease accessory UreF family protein, partial [Terrimicrobiaceae bacterium]
MRTITDSFIDWLPALLQISDAAFPTGSYAHSYGLEEIVRQGAVCDEESLHEFFEEHVLPALTHVDLPLAREARSAAISGDRDDLMTVDRLAGALRIPRELREASLQTGRRRLAILIRLRPT